MNTATPSGVAGGMAPTGEVPPPPLNPSACAPIPLRQFLAQMGLEVTGGVNVDKLEVIGFKAPEVPRAQDAD